MAPLAFRVLLLGAGANAVLLHSAGAGDAAHVRGKRPRTGEFAARSPNGRSYVYIAGVPGTGQDFWRGALRRCTEAKLCEPRAFSFYTGMLFGSESRVNQSWVRSDRQPSDRIVPMNLVSPDRDRQPDSAFYRAFSKQLSGFEDPRLPLYHKLARSNGDSLKVVVLTRSNEKELLAWSMHKYKLSEQDADVRLAADIRTLAMQLSALPAESYRCVSFEEMRAARGASLKPMARLGDLRAEAFSLKLHHLLTRGMFGCGFTGKGIEATWDCPHLHVTAPKTRAALNLLEDLCDPADLLVKPQNAIAEKIQWLME